MQDMESQAWALGNRPAATRLLLNSQLASFGLALLGHDSSQELEGISFNRTGKVHELNYVQPSFAYFDLGHVRLPFGKALRQASSSLSH
jgi:hypothetical protein